MNEFEDSSSSLYTTSNYDQDLARVKKRFSKLTMNGGSTNSLSSCLVEHVTSKSPRSLTNSGKDSKLEKGNATQTTSSNLKKRRFRQLERSDLFETLNDKNCEEVK